MRVFWGDTFERAFSRRRILRGRDLLFQGRARRIARRIFARLKVLARRIRLSINACSAKVEERGRIGWTLRPDDRRPLRCRGRRTWLARRIRDERPSAEAGKPKEQAGRVRRAVRLAKNPATRRGARRKPAGQTGDEGMVDSLFCHSAPRISDVIRHLASEVVHSLNYFVGIEPDILSHPAPVADLNVTEAIFATDLRSPAYGCADAPRRWT